MIITIKLTQQSYRYSMSSREVFLLLDVDLEKTIYSRDADTILVNLAIKSSSSIGPDLEDKNVVVNIPGLNHPIIESVYRPKWITKSELIGDNKKCDLKYLMVAWYQEKDRKESIFAVYHQDGSKERLEITNEDEVVYVLKSIKDGIEELYNLIERNTKPSYSTFLGLSLKKLFFFKK